MNIEKLIYEKPLTLREICELMNEEIPRGKAQQLFFKKLKEFVTIKEEGKGRGKKYILSKKNNENFCSPNQPTNNDISYIYKDNNIEFGGKIGEQKHTFWHTPNYDNWNILFSDLPIGESYDTIKKICEEANITYDIKNPSRSLELIQQLYTLVTIKHFPLSRQFVYLL